MTGRSRPAGRSLATTDLGGLGKLDLVGRVGLVGTSGKLDQVRKAE